MTSSIINEAFRFLYLVQLLMAVHFLFFLNNFNPNQFRSEKQMASPVFRQFSTVSSAVVVGAALSRKTNPINYLWLYIFDAILGSVLNYGVSDRSRTVNRPKSPYLLTLLHQLWNFQF